MFLLRAKHAENEKVYKSDQLILRETAFTVGMQQRNIAYIEL